MHCYCLVKGKKIHKQIEEAIAHYQSRFEHKPQKVFINPVNEIDMTTINGVAIEFTERMKPPNIIGLGDEFPKIRKSKLEAKTNEK